ncbi:S8 family serine peptidase [Pelotalea chapellei]|uniref:S8 family serine peptidase n=1 Tax=Pelotalea chapellei TaxID=44671 RepID=A0ABS5UCB4_9BACT|nr:S8 family serine peptidase [Pelotalea chapellei]
MSGIISGLTGIMLMVFLLGGVAYSAQNDLKHERREGEVIVKFRKERKNLDTEDFHKRHGSQRLRHYKGLDMERVRIKPGKSIADAISELQADPDVEYVEPNYIVHTQVIPTDTSYGSLWGMNKISAPAAWDNNIGSQSVVVGVIDTGIDYNHPDLKANLWPGRGYNAITGSNDPLDDNGHGTHVAGTIGATGNNGQGVAGVNWNVQIMACKFMDSTGSGTTADAIECLNYFRQQKAAGVNIVATNNSWGGGGFSRSLFDAINAQRDILFIAAAGNNASNNDTTATYPANYQLPNVISVAATTSSDSLSSFSQYGRRTVSIAAPGSNIYSTKPNSSYGLMSGTSMATPHVTGLAALIKASRPAADWRSIKNLLLSGGDNVTSLAAATLTGKRINAFTSLTCQDSRVLSVIQYPAVVQPGTPATLSALSINCSAPAGPVMVNLSGGEVITLKDDGIAPDLAAGDGIFTATFTPTRSIETFSLTSPAGAENIGNAPAPAPAPAPLVITTAALPGSMAGTSYSQTLAASGGTAPYAWSVAAGLLPGGLALGASGTISGTPVAAGTAAFTVKVSDAKGVFTTRNYTLSVAPAPVQATPVVIATKYFPPGVVGSLYSTYLGASGGKSPYLWSLQSGSLPAGLTLNPTTGALSGIPSAAGTFSCVVKVTDSLGAYSTGSFSVQLANYAITSARAGYAYSYRLNASGGTSPYTWALTGGELPPGLTLASSGVISGIPSKTGSYVFTAKVTDSRGLSGVSTILMKVL